jgi:hypothetical protein
MATSRLWAQPFRANDVPIGNPHDRTLTGIRKRANSQLFVKLYFFLVVSLVAIHIGMVETDKRASYMADTTTSPAPRSSWRLIVSTIAGVVVFLVASAIAVAWLAPEQNDTQVIEEWNATISKLGIDPVFPPEEDVAVGDIYAVLNDRDDGQPSRTALALRSIKLDHKDLTDDIKQVYAKSYRFPSTTPRPEDQNKPWEQTADSQGVMGHPNTLETLPLAAFPGFIIKQTKSYRGGLLGWLSTTFGFQSDTGVELNIPVAETYGIPSVTAVGELVQYCTDENDPKRCTSETLRRHLAYVTPLAFERKPNDPDNPPKPGVSASPFRYRVEVVLVNRVYLARYIDQHFHDLRTARSWIGRPDKKPEVATPAEQATSEKAGATQPANQAGVALESDDSQTLKQTFLRPITIGYRAVRQGAEPDLIDPKTDTSKVKVSAAVSQKVQRCFSGSDACAKENLAATPPVALNATQTTGAVGTAGGDARRFRLYLHTAKQPKDTIAAITDALGKAGYTIQGAEDDADTDGGAGVDYFNDADSAAAANIAKIVSGAFAVAKDRPQAVSARRQRLYNPIGVLGIWLP